MQIIIPMCNQNFNLQKNSKKQRSSGKKQEGKDFER